MGILLDTASTGQSEVLETLHYEGAVKAGIPLYRLGAMVSHRWLGDENREGSDSTWEADIITVIGALQRAKYVSGHDTDGNAVDLTDSPPETTFVTLTKEGRVYARSPRPRARRIIAAH